MALYAATQPWAPVEIVEADRKLAAIYDHCLSCGATQLEVSTSDIPGYEVRQIRCGRCTYAISPVYTKVGESTGEYHGL